MLSLRRKPAYTGVPPFPFVTLLDAFTGTNGTSLPAYDAANWGTVTNATNNLIQSNAVQGGTASGTNINRWLPTSYGNFDVTYKVTTKTADTFDQGLWVRTTTTDVVTTGGYILDFGPTAGTDVLLVVRVDPGPVTNTLLTVNQELTAGDSVGFRVIGNSFSIYYKPAAGPWTLLGSVSDSNYPNPGGLWIYTSDTTGLMDDLSAGAI